MDSAMFGADTICIIRNDRISTITDKLRERLKLMERRKFANNVSNHGAKPQL
jgi:hypothetical protein